MTEKQAVDLADELRKIINRDKEGQRAEFHVGSNPVSDEQAATIAHAAGYELVRYQSENCPDKDLVNEVGLLIAVPSKLSWQTIRYAREAGKAVTLISPEGDHIPKELMPELSSTTKPSLSF